MGCLQPGQLSGQGRIHAHRTPSNLQYYIITETFGARITESSSKSNSSSSIIRSGVGIRKDL